MLALLLGCRPAAPPPDPPSDGVLAAHALLVQLEPDLPLAEVSAVCDGRRCRVRAPLAEAVDEAGLAAELAVLAAPGAVSDTRVHAGEPTIVEFVHTR